MAVLVAARSCIVGGGVRKLSSVVGGLQHLKDGGLGQLQRPAHWSFAYVGSSEKKYAGSAGLSTASPSVPQGQTFRVTSQAYSLANHPHGQQHFVGFASQPLFLKPPVPAPISPPTRPAVSYQADPSANRSSHKTAGTELQFNRGAAGSSQPPSEPLLLSIKPLVYVGSMSDTLKKVKVLSITSCVLSMLGAPVITFWTAPTLPMVVKTVVSISMVAFGAGTTGLLHWFSSPYVHKVEWIRGSPEMTVHTLTWMATTSKHVVRLEDVQPAKTQRPLVTFAANNRFYYVDGANFVTPAGKELREKLLPFEYQD